VTPKETKVGVFVRVKKDVWFDFCVRSQRDLDEPQPEQPIISVPTHQPLAGYVMLAYPFWWWKPDELEVA